MSPFPKKTAHTVAPQTLSNAAPAEERATATSSALTEGHTATPPSPKNKWKARKLFSLIDGLLLAAIALIATVGLLFLPKGEGKVADVYLGGTLYATLSLAKDGEYPLPITNGTNVIAVEGGKIYMKTADCPDRSCVYAGKISKKGSVIACLPHGVKIVVRGEREGVDG